MLQMEYDSIYEQIAKGAIIHPAIKLLGMRKVKKAINIF